MNKGFSFTLDSFRADLRQDRVGIASTSHINYISKTDTVTRNAHGMSFPFRDSYHTGTAAHY